MFEALRKDPRFQKLANALADQISDTELRTQLKKLSSEGLAKVANRIAAAR
jgi:DNA-binding HxlR family transcriptional regulator